jgi:hypothetical protein
MLASLNACCFKARVKKRGKRAEGGVAVEETELNSFIERARDRIVERGCTVRARQGIFIYLLRPRELKTYRYLQGREGRKFYACITVASNYLLLALIYPLLALIYLLLVSFYLLSYE